MAMMLSTSALAAASTFTSSSSSFAVAEACKLLAGALLRTLGLEWAM